MIVFARVIPAMTGAIILCDAGQGNEAEVWDLSTRNSFTGFDR
jgi:hypothetical protein